MTASKPRWDPFEYLRTHRFDEDRWNPSEDAQWWELVSVGNDGIIDALYVVDVHGAIEAVGLPPESRSRRPDLLVGDFSSSRLFRNALEAQRPIWSDKYLSAMSGSFVIGVAIPVGQQVIIGEISPQAILDTTQGLKVLATGFPSVPLCVWLNPYFGEISMDGLGFTSFKIYQEHERQIHAVIQIPSGNKSTLGQDLQELYAKRDTFKTALDAESSLSIAVRSRLRRYFDQIVTAVKVAQITA